MIIVEIKKEPTFNLFKGVIFTFVLKTIYVRPIKHEHEGIVLAKLASLCALVCEGDRGDSPLTGVKQHGVNYRVHTLGGILGVLTATDQSLTSDIKGCENTNALKMAFLIKRNMRK